MESLWDSWWIFILISVVLTVILGKVLDYYLGKYIKKFQDRKTLKKEKDNEFVEHLKKDPYFRELQTRYLQQFSFATILTFLLAFGSYCMVIVTDNFPIKESNPLSLAAFEDFNNIASYTFLTFLFVLVMLALISLLIVNKKFLLITRALHQLSKENA